MVQLPNNLPDGELCSYVKNFERWVLAEGLKQPFTTELNLDQKYDALLSQWGGVWYPEGFCFEDERNATAFLLRWT